MTFFHSTTPAAAASLSNTSPLTAFGQSSLLHSELYQDFRKECRQTLFARFSRSQAEKILKEFDDMAEPSVCQRWRQLNSRHHFADTKVFLKKLAAFDTITALISQCLQSPLASLESDLSIVRRNRYYRQAYELALAAEEIRTTQKGELLIQPQHMLERLAWTYRVCVYCNPSAIESLDTYLENKIATLTTDQINNTSLNLYTLLDLTNSIVLPRYLELMILFEPWLTNLSCVVRSDRLQLWIDQTSPLLAFSLVNEWYYQPSLDTLQQLIVGHSSQLARIVTTLMQARPVSSDVGFLHFPKPTKIISLATPWQGAQIVEKKL